MEVRPQVRKNSIGYDILLSILYAWSVFQAYVYDAKTQTTGILIYVVVYAGFTLLVRSRFGIVVMSVLSAITIPVFFTAPIFQQAGSYFDFQPFIGIGATILIGVIQGIVTIPLFIWGGGFLMRKHQYSWSAAVAIAFAVILTFVCSLVHARF